jgi:ankyrin repeat protein
MVITKNKKCYLFLVFLFSSLRKKEISFMNIELLQDASWVGDLETVKNLLENKADINAGNNGPLRCASANGHLEIVKFLVENKADVNAENNAIQPACENGRLEIVKFLVENKADITANNNEAVQWASRFHRMEIVKFLLSKGADYSRMKGRDKKYFRSLKAWRRWRKVIFFRRLTQIALPLYYSPGFPGWKEGRKCLEEFVGEMKP